MLLKGAIFAGVLALFYLSLCRRVQHKKRVWKQSREIPVEPQESAFSQAVVELLGTAGGVYLALLLIRNFLQVNVPDQVMIAGLQLEPMAAISLLVAICQPYFLLFFHR
ncbi:MAG: hypothetical protein ACOYEO_02190 [bacterium]|jgi:hypothetical protein